MGFSLKGFLKGVGADLNMFDDGKSHGNMQGRPRTARPASTARPNVNRPQNRGLQVEQVDQPQLQAPQPIYQQAINVQPVQQPQLTVAPPQPIKPLQVGVAKPQNLQVGNQTITQTPGIRTQTQARTDFLEKQRNPSLIDQALQTPAGQVLKTASYAPGSFKDALAKVGAGIIKSGIDTAKLPYEGARLVTAEATHNDEAITNATQALNEKAAGSWISPLTSLAVMGGTNLAANQILNDPNTSDELKQAQLGGVNEALAPIGYNLNDSAMRTNLKNASLFTQAIATPILSKGGSMAIKPATNTGKEAIQKGVTSQLVTGGLKPIGQSLAETRGAIANVTTKLVPKPLNEGGYIQMPGGKQINDPLYHGSPNADQIRKEGFKNISSDVNASNSIADAYAKAYSGGVKNNIKISGNTYGDGVYLTDDVERAKEYGRGTNPFVGKDDVKNVLKVNVPKNAKIYKPKDVLTELFGKDTNYGDPALITKKYKDLGYDGLEIKAPGRKFGDREVIVFDAKNTKVNAPKPKTIHKEDQATMNDFVQYTKGKYKPKGKDAHELEIEASRIAEHYGLPMPNSTKELGKAFEKELATRGFNKPRPIVGAAQQSTLAKSAQVGKTDFTKLQETGKTSLSNEDYNTLVDFAGNLKEGGVNSKTIDKFIKGNHSNIAKLSQTHISKLADKNGDITLYRVSRRTPTTERVGWTTSKDTVEGWHTPGETKIYSIKVKPTDVSYWDGILPKLNKHKLNELAGDYLDYAPQDQEVALNNIKPLSKLNELPSSNEAGFIAPGQIASDVKSFGNKIKSKFKPLGDQGTLGKADETSPTIKNALTGETIDNPHYKKPETPYEIQAIQNKIDAGEMVSPRNYARAKEWEKTGLDIKAPREAKPIVGPNLSRSSKPPKSTPIISSKEPTLGVKTPKQVVKEVKSTLEGKPPKQAKAKLVDSASKSDKIPQDIVEAIDPTRSVKTNTESWNNAGQIIYEHGDDGALKYFQENHGAEANAVAWRLFQKRLASNDKPGAQSLLADMTTRSIEDGQSAQAWAMIKKLDPTYIVAKLDREVTRFSNKTSNRLKDRIDWTAEKQAKILQYSKGLGDDKIINKLTKINDTDKISKLTGITDKKTLKGLAKTNDPERVKMFLTSNLNKEMNSIIPSGAGDKAISYWKSGLLSAPVTHVRNLVGNTMNATANVLETPLAGGFDATVGRALTPTKRTVSANPLTGVGRGLKKGGQDFADAIQTGITADDVSKYNYKTVNWNLKNPAEKYVFKPFTDAIFRTLGAEDKIFKAPGVLTSLYNQADAAAISAGKRGDAKWMADWIENAPPIVKETAKKEGGAWVFQKDTVVSTGMRALRRGIKQKHPGYEKIVEAIQPFVNVPAAIGSELMTYTPAGVLRVTNKSRKAIDKNLDITIRDTYRRQAMKDLSKTTVGVGIMTAGFAMGLSGDASGNMPPKNSREYDQWVLENRQPNSVKIGGRWFNINSVGPQLTLFNAAAQTGAQKRRDKNKGKDPGLADTAIAFGGNVGTNFLNSSSLTGATDATNALKDPARYGTNYVARQGTSFIPNFAKRAGSGFDPYQHDPQNFKEAVQAQIPGARNKLAAKTDVTDAKVPNNQYGPFAAKALFDPFNVSKSRSSTLATSLGDQINTDAKNKVAKDEAKKQIDGGKSTVKAKNGKVVSKIDGEYQTFDNQKDADKAVAKSKFAKSDENYKVVGDRVFTKNAEGKVSDTSKVSYDYKLNSEKLTSYKNNDDIENWVNTASAQLDSIDKQLKDKNIDPLDKVRLENDAVALKKNINKYSGYGGFTKPKVGKKGGKGKGKSKSSSGFDYAKGFASVSKLASSNQNAVRNIVKKNRIIRKARKA